MTDQPEALRLAEWLETSPTTHDKAAAAELRRLHDVNQELVEALKGFVEMGRGFDMGDIRRGREILAKAEGHENS